MLMISHLLPRPPAGVDLFPVIVVVIVVLAEVQPGEVSLAQVLAGQHDVGPGHDHHGQEHQIEQELLLATLARQPEHHERE